MANIEKEPSNICSQELENNPMKLLEERTAASKHEMDLAESLDELKELNRRWRRYSDLRIMIVKRIICRKTEVNTEDIVRKLNNGTLAKRAEDEEIAKDEAFIAAAFRFSNFYNYLIIILF